MNNIIQYGKVDFNYSSDINRIFKLLEEMKKKIEEIETEIVYIKCDVKYLEKK